MCGNNKIYLMAFVFNLTALRHSIKSKPLSRQSGRMQDGRNPIRKLPGVLILTRPRKNCLLSRNQVTVARGLDPATSHTIRYSLSAIISPGFCRMLTVRGRTVKKNNQLITSLCSALCGELTSRSDEIGSSSWTLAWITTGLFFLFVRDPRL